MLIEFNQIHEFFNKTEKVCIDTNKIISIGTYSEEPSGNEEFVVGFLINNSIKIPYIFYTGVCCMADVDKISERKKQAQTKLYEKLEEIKQFL